MATIPSIPWQRPVHVVCLLATLIAIYYFVPAPFSPNYLLNWKKMDKYMDLRNRHFAKLNSSFSERIHSTKVSLLQNSITHLNIMPHHSVVLDANNSIYLSQLENLTQVQTLLFDIPTQNLNKYLPKQLFTIHSNDCKKLFKKGLLSDQNTIGDLRTYHHKDYNCSESAEYHSKQTAFYTSRFGLGTLTGNFNTQLLSAEQQQLQISASAVTVDFLHVVKDAIVLPEGDFHVGKYRISIQRCHRELVSKVGSGDIATFPEVYSIAQYWGGGVFHFFIEDLPRIMIGLEYLIKNKHVKVHVTTQNDFVKNLLKDIGIDPSRLVSGVVKANILLVPRGTVCGCGAVFNTNSLSLHMWSLSGQTKPKQDTIILIKRSTRRWFHNHRKILNMIQSISRKVNLNVRVFGDQPVMQLQDAKKLFHRAVMVVAPHGAGLSNLIFSQPGTCVVEGLCNMGTYAIFCYERLAFILGHRYHGVAKPCMKIQPEDLRLDIEKCLEAVL